MTTTTENKTAQIPGELRTVHIGHAASVTVRMPTADECARGCPEGAPVLVVSDGVRKNVFPHWVTLEFDDPHGQPEPDAARDAAAYVLDIAAERLGLAVARVEDLAAALRGSPCEVTHLADKVRQEEADAWHCADASMCDLARPVARAT